ncbi:MAG: hypothetical protein ACFB01_09675 [Cohaesibacteraceae bacterium]
MIIPSKILHYYSRSDYPFSNLCDLEPDALASVLDMLNRRKVEQPGFKRVFGSAYMEFRRRTEAKMRKLFVQRGGKPERMSPHYFILGDCPWFAGLYPDTATIELDWQSLPREVVSFTYPDSFIAMRFVPDYGLPEEPLQPYHDKVFLTDEIEDVVAIYGLPDGGAGEAYEGYQTRKFEKYIEAQIWSDTPVAAYL